MNCWTVLGISATSNEQEIKKAYRSKLREHHPEEDPEGFQRVRLAYEEALQERNRSQSHESVAPFAHPKSPLSDSQSLQHDHFELLKTILDDERKRFDDESIENWLKSAQRLPLTEFELLSTKTIQLVLTLDWLPGEVIKKLYDGFDWVMLLDNNNDAGQFIQHRSQQISGVSLQELHQLSGAEQRSTLNFVRSFCDALDASRLDAAQYVLSQANQFTITRHKSIALKVCICFQAGVDIAPAIVDNLITRLLEEHTLSLSVDDLTLLAKCAFRLSDHTLTTLISEQLFTRKHYGEYCEIQYQCNKDDNQELALCYAFLRQKLWPTTNAYWHAELCSRQKSKDRTAEQRQRWIAYALKGDSFSVFSNKLDLHEQQGFYGMLLQAFWLGSVGDWRTVGEISESLQRCADSNESEPHQNPLIEITSDWLKQLLTSRSACDSLLTKLNEYGQDEWFEVSPITEHEIASMTRESWRDCLIRHPLVPDSWVSELISQDIIDEQFIQESDKLPDYIYRLYHVRYRDSSFTLTSPWKGQSFQGVFNWAQAYYAQGTTQKRENCQLLQLLTELPASLNESPFHILADLLASPNSYQPSVVEQLSDFPEQYIAKYITNSQIEFLYQHCDLDELIEQAKKGEACAYMALSWHLQHTHSEESIIFWNLCAASCASKPQYSYAIEWQQESIRESLSEAGLMLDEFHYNSPEFIRAFITTNPEWFTPVEELYDITPAKEARAFHFPMAILLTHLHCGINEKGYDFKQLKSLYTHKKLQTKLQRNISNIAVTELESMYQKKLDHDIQSGTATVKSNKRLSITLLTLLIVQFPLSIFIDVQFDLDGLFTGIGMLIFLIGEVIWCVYIAKGMTSVVNKVTTFGYIYTMLILSSLFGPLLLVHLISLFACTGNLSPLYVNGGWEKKIIQSRKVNMRKVLGVIR